MIQAATALLAEAKLTPELQNEALYLPCQSLSEPESGEKGGRRPQASGKRHPYIIRCGSRVSVVAQLMYNAGEYAAAEKEILNFIDQSTPHAYWLARSFILLSDVYVAMDKKLDARQYLLSLQQNYHADDDIERMIQERLEKLK